MCQTGQCAQCQSLCQQSQNIVATQFGLAIQQQSYSGQAVQSQSAYMGLGALRQQQGLGYQQVQQQAFPNERIIYKHPEWEPIIALLETANIILDTPEKVEEMKEMMTRLIKMKAFW